MTTCEILKGVIKGRGITYSHISKITGIPIDAISSSLNGKRVLKADEFISICMALHINMDMFREPPKTA